ncbi:pentapeptide repeat-containing protein [Streptomyces sp. NPDC048442]|uniref:pentapeptide repeat-containing protein n=1 Tax=Streptomyces sp. NPDC048442 TaxID=3154823 RepID=UPI003425ABB9
MRNMKPTMKRTLLGVALALVIVGYALLLWRGPWWIDGAHLRTTNLQPADGVVITGFRTMLVAVGAGVVAGLGLYYTHRSHRHAEKLYAHSQEQFAHVREKDRELAELAREAQVTERYVEAIKLLGSASMTERLGGIYSLERIMRDSEKDHQTVVEVLAAHIRDFAESQAAGADSVEGVGSAKRPPHDVTAAFVAIGRRPERPEAFRTDLRVSDLREVNLSEANLHRAELGEARLQGAVLRGANLHRANLSGARLEEADLSDANLHDADLTMAFLTGANLRGANLHQACLRQVKLKGADLSGGNLHGADLSGAVLTGVDLRGANLAETRLWAAFGLTPEQLAAARIFSTTELPRELADTPVVQARIRECDAESQGNRGH